MGRKDGGWLLPSVIDPPRKSVCVPVPDDPEHRRAFVGALYQLTYWWNWQRDDDKRGREVARVWLEIWHQVVELLDEGAECGEDMSETIDSVNEVRQMLAELKSELRTRLIYDGGPGSINPDAPAARFDSATPAQTEDESILRRAALCLAVRRFVHETVYQFHARAAAAAGVAGAAGAVAFLLGGPLGFVSGALVMALSAYSYQQVLDAASDMDAIEEIICDLRNLLAGKTVNQANFADAINDLDLGTGNRAVLVDMLKTFRNQLENYTFMLDLLGSGYLAAQAGAEDDCCDDDDCLQFWDFRENSQGWTLLYGTHVAGEGFVADNVDGAHRTGAIYKFFPEGCTATRICIHWHGTVSDVDGLALRYQWYRETSPGVFQWVEAGSAGGGFTGENWILNATANPPGAPPFYGLRLIWRKLNSSAVRTLRTVQLRNDADVCEDQP